MKLIKLSKLCAVMSLTAITACGSVDHKQAAKSFPILGDYRPMVFRTAVDLGATNVVYPLNGRPYHMYDIKNRNAWDTHGLVEILASPEQRSASCKRAADAHQAPVVQWLFVQTKTDGERVVYLKTNKGTVKTAITPFGNPHPPGNEIALASTPQSNTTDDSPTSFDYFLMFNNSSACSRAVAKVYQVEIFPSHAYTDPDSQECNNERPDISGNWGTPLVFNPPSECVMQIGNGSGNEPDHP